MSQNSQKKTVPSQHLGGLELQPETAGNLQVLRNAPPQPQAQGNQVIGQGIVAPNAHPKQPQPHYNQADEISTFFRNRQMVVQGSGGVSPILKLFVFICIAMGSFIAAWNYVSQFRKKTQALAETHLGISLADYIPAWTKRAKKFERTVDSEIAQRQPSQRPGAAGVVTLDPLYLSVIAGYWPQVESHVANKCISWEASSACGLRVWYNAYRGYRSSLKPIFKIKPEQIQKLSMREQAIFRFGMATASDGIASTKLFEESIAMLGQDMEFKRILFDARFKLALRENRQSELPSLIQLAKSISSGPFDLSRWRMLEISTRTSASGKKLSADQIRIYGKQMQELLQKFSGPFKSDPVSFISIGNFALRLGLAHPVALIAGPLSDEALKAPMDSGLRREIFLVSARASMLEGDTASAAQKIMTTQTKDGPDSVTNHLLGSIYLEMRSSVRLPEAINLFQAAIKTRNTWQSQIGLLTALIRAEKLKDARRVAANLVTAKTKENELWVSLALARYKLAVAGSSGNLSPARYKEVADSIAWVYVKHPDWQGLSKIYADALVGSGQNSEAQKIRMSMDDMSSKTSYLSSAEFLESPIGPFGLMR